MGELAIYAVSENNSRGRQYNEATSPYRNEFQRDRDRIIHSNAFRRLEYKTQVFTNHEGDLFRTRLTHSLEVAQLSRTVANNLNLNTDLCEAIALAHDLGHTPFGHAGQDVLDECMSNYGGFEHNFQSLRIVDKLEHRYPNFNGLNLTYETREGILKHCSTDKIKYLGSLGERFLNKENPSLEAQIVNLADEIAYNNHDIDDALRANIITIKQLRTQDLFNEHYNKVIKKWVKLPKRLLIYTIVRQIIDAQIINLIDTSRVQLEALQLKNIDEVRSLANEELITFSALMYERHLELKRFLQDNIYKHYKVQRMSIKAKKIIQALFTAFNENINLLPMNIQDIINQSSNNIRNARMRAIADYIAGMTDRYAIIEYERLFNISLPIL
jgi:dGTPase